MFSQRTIGAIIGGVTIALILLNLFRTSHLSKLIIRQSNNDTLCDCPEAEVFCPTIPPCICPEVPASTTSQTQTIQVIKKVKVAWITLAFVRRISRKSIIITDLRVVDRTQNSHRTCSKVLKIIGARTDAIFMMFTISL